MAADTVLFIGWNRAVAGREKTCVELFGTTMKYWAKQKEAGNIESYEPVVLSAHGGDLNGFVLVRGEQAQLSKVRASEEFADLITQLNINAEGVGAIHGWTGEGVAKMMTRYQKNLK
jgi:hypothetical protein